MLNEWCHRREDSIQGIQNIRRERDRERGAVTKTKRSHASQRPSPSAKFEIRKRRTKSEGKGRPTPRAHPVRWLLCRSAAAPSEYRQFLRYTCPGPIELKAPTTSAQFRTLRTST
ncbi:unnamed protein product, partial [Iphiclides podalirius]